MKKNLCLLGLVVVCLFIVSCTKENAESEEKMNIEQKIGQLQEKIQELAIKIETNPESDEAGAWREKHQQYINEIEELKAGSKREAPRGELSEMERVKRAMQEYSVALEQNPDHENAEQWRGALRELEQELKRLEEGGEVDRPRTQAGEFPELESAIKNAEEQLHEMELYLVDLREKKESEEKMKEAEEQLVKKRNEFSELKVLLEKRKQGIREDQPSAYQREQGELEAYVISATSEDVTVRVKDSGKVMVFRIPLWRRVEGQRVENTEMKKFASKLKKDQLIWIDYREGEERGSYFAVGMKKIK